MRLEAMLIWTDAGLFPFALRWRVVAAAIPGMLRHHDNPNYRSLGASGAVSAVLIAYIYIFQPLSCCCSS